MAEHDGILTLAAPPGGERIAYGNAAQQFGELRIPPGKGPYSLAVVIHGGFWRAAYGLDHIAHLCVGLNAVGMATWSLEYRRIGDPDGGWRGTFDDVLAGTRHIQKFADDYAIDRTRVIVIGHSAGGQLALWVASDTGIRAVVALAPVADLRRAYELGLSNTVVCDLIEGSPTQLPERYSQVSPIERLPLDKPQRLIHGSLDTIVPIEISQTYVAAARRAGDDAQLMALAGVGHFEPIDPRTRQFETVRRAALEVCEMN